MLHLKNLDELASNVYNPDTKEYLREIIATYRAGSYRATTVILWVAIQYDLLAKFREIADSGDREARRYCDEFDKAMGSSNIESLLKIENSLLSKALGMELIDRQANRLLQRIQEDRNHCAHQSHSSYGLLYNPTPEQTHAHIVNAIENLFCLPPVIGKNALEKFFADISTILPSGEKEMVSFLDNRYFGRAKTVFVRNVIICLLKNIFGEKTIPVERVRLLDILSVIHNLKKTEFEHTLTRELGSIVQNSGKEYLKVGVFGLRNFYSSAWDSIGNGEQSVIIDLLRKGVLNDNLFKHSDILLAGALLVPEVKSIIIETLLPKMDIDDFLSLVRVTRHKDLLPRLISYLKVSGSWADSNKRLLYITAYYGNTLSGNLISEILQIVKENAEVRLARDTGELLSTLFDKIDPSLRAETITSWEAIIDLEVVGGDVLKEKLERYKAGPTVYIESFVD